MKWGVVQCPLHDSNEQNVQRTVPCGARLQRSPAVGHFVRRRGHAGKKRLNSNFPDRGHGGERKRF